MRNFLFIILILTTFAGCVVPNTFHKAKWKVDKIVDKWPEVLENDTTIINIDTTIITKSSKLDSVIKIKKNDTVYISKEKLKIRFIRGKRDSFYIEGECIPDTVRINIKEKIPVYSIDDHNLRGRNNFKWWYWILIFLGLVTILYIPYRKWKKKL